MSVSQAGSEHAAVGAPAVGYHHAITIAAAGHARTELVDIVKRSHRLGFCRWRVATALGASPCELALIDKQTTAERGRDDQALIDVGSITGLHGLHADRRR